MLLEITKHDWSAMGDANVANTVDAVEQFDDKATFFCTSPLSGRPMDDLVAIRGPQVETRRLVLRPMQMDDFSDYARIMADPRMWVYSDRGPMTGEESWTRFLRQLGHWQAMGYGAFAVTDRSTGRFVGEVGFSQFNRNLGGHFDWAPEASWMIDPDCHGDGLASEALAGAVTWQERQIGSTRTVCIVHSRNLASLRVAEKLGFRAFKRSEFRGYPAVFFERVVIGL